MVRDQRHPLHRCADRRCRFLIFHEEIQATIYRAMTVMVVASPCALVISTPASILSAIAAAARRGVLFKGGVYLEKAAADRYGRVRQDGHADRGKPAGGHQPAGHRTSRTKRGRNRLLGGGAALARGGGRGAERTSHRARRRGRGQAALHAGRALHEIPVGRGPRRQRRGRRTPHRGGQPEIFRRLRIAGTDRAGGANEPAPRRGQNRDARRGNSRPARRAHGALSRLHRRGRQGAR